MTVEPAAAAAALAPAATATATVRNRPRVGPAPAEGQARLASAVMASGRIASARITSALALPEPRGPVTQALVRLLLSSPVTPDDAPALTWRGTAVDAAGDDDLQLALWTAYEVDRRGLSGVDDGWRHRLPAVRSVWEEQVLAGLRERIRTDRAFRGPSVRGGQSDRSTTGEDRRSILSRHLMCDASSRQFAEFLVHRSVHHLQARPDRGAAAGAGVGPGAGAAGGTDTASVRLFRRLLQDWDLADGYGGYVDAVPGVSLLATNLVSLFAALPARRLALAGYRAQTETTASEANSRYGWGHRRLGGGRSGAEFFDAHVVDDEPAAQVIRPTPLTLSSRRAGAAGAGSAHTAEHQFGRRCALVADELFAAHLLDAWSSGRSSLRRPLAWPLP